MGETSIGPNRRNRFACCGSAAWVMEHADQPGRFRIAANYCRDRWCRPCANARAGRAARVVLKHIAPLQIRFVTLTVQTTGLTLRESLKKLLDGWKALRRTKLWKNTQRGGVAFLEIKYNERLERWHPHLHILTEGKFLPHAALRKAWHGLTQDSFIVDVRAVPDHDKAAAYVSKYATNPLGKGVWSNQARLAEAMEALKGRKTAATFASWRGLRLNPETAVEPWTPVAPLAALINRANQGEPFATRILETLTKGKKWTNTNNRAPPTPASETLFE